MSNINRLRSTQRFGSMTSLNSVRTAADLAHLNGSPASSRFDALSRQSSLSNLHDQQGSSDPKATSSASSQVDVDALASSSSSLRWTPLRKISTRVYPSHAGSRGLNGHVLPSSNMLGAPTTLAASGVICIGTAKGWVSVFDYAQTLRCICGNDAICTSLLSLYVRSSSQANTNCR